MTTLEAVKIIELMIFDEFFSVVNLFGWVVKLSSQHR